MREITDDFARRIASLEREVEHLRRIQECTASLIASLDLEETLHTILNTALEVVGARRGSILLYNPGRTHLRIANAVGLREETIASTQVRDGEGISGRVARSGEPILVEDIEADPRFVERRSRPDRSRSFACLPLTYRERTLGVMNLSHPKDETRFRRNSLPLLAALANQAAVAIAHSEMHRSLIEKQRLEQQIETARAIQDGFVPPSLHVAGGRFEFAGRNEAAKTVGGDLYDIVAAPGGRYAFFLGDVSGKGVPAALYMAKLFSDVHHFIGMDPEPEAVLSALNAALCERRRRGMFVTMAYGLAAPAEGSIRLALAGHPPPLVRREDGSSFFLPPPVAPPLGLLPSIRLRAFDVELPPGDLILFYSDGATETADRSGEEFGPGRLEHELRRAGRGYPEVVDFLFGRLADFSGGAPARDDITLLAAGSVSSTNE